MEIGVCVLLAFLFHQVAHVGGQGDGGHEGCVPGFQVKKYQVMYRGPFQKGQRLLQVEFDDCAGNEDVTFGVSDPGFHVDGDLNLVPLRDLPRSEPVLFIHGVSAHADDLAQVDIIGTRGRSPHASLHVIGRGVKLPYRSKRSLLVPNISISENERGPFPKFIGQDPKGLFTIDMNSGAVSVSRSVDREARDSYQLEVSTTDYSGNLIEGPQVFRINVIDQNDNRPIFKEPRYTGEVLEGSPTGTTVMTMTAFDADDPNTDNAVLRYNIVKQSPDKPSPNMFYIDAERGDIVTVIAPTLLDRETLPTTTYELEIMAKDMAGSEVGLTGTTTATITITDKNDHAPEFTHPLFEAHVYEGSTGVVVNLTVDDRDDPATAAWRAMYSIISGDPTQSFEIQTNPDNNEGMLSVVKPLNYEASEFLSLLIKVENEDPLVPDVGYGPSSTATVHVRVEDINEGPVFFPDPLIVTRMENIPVGSFVASLNATDPDILEKQSIRYAVLQDPAGWLSVNPVRGTVNTSASLDRESPYVHDNKYTAVFIATDNATHSQIRLLRSLKKDNYQLPLLITDSGVPPLSNNTEVKVQVCICNKNRMHCSSAHSHRARFLVPLATLLLTLLCL
ncbi:cadherin-13 [Neolamprologus brichardi]|uniref:cadherin-13 n=1 Tax=Neolamprologus brichardi TaxID=32507 RepID=UPI001643B52F|nr:cadherin-13 [Neolamprologus brichardi]